MVFSAGDCLGHYEILAPIGRGGMGEVYRARDERLDRNVAIKALPEEVAQDEARLARFEREARLLASLSHQNIAALHGLEEHEGRRFLVMELAEGETLAERIEKGPIPVEDALPMALQIAEGLEAAHEQGIIHRDLKPANVMLSHEGKVKILDFGLAKAWAPEESDADLSHSPTLTAQTTAAGVLLGTAAYMSPEQARGKPVDKRADVWAFGCVLYECLTGRQAFPGDTISDTLAAILKADPDWARLPTAAPEALRRLLRRCLARDPWHRLRSLGDARLEIEEAMAEAGRSPAGSRVPSQWPAWLVLPVVAVLGILALALITVGRHARDSEGEIVYQPLTHQRGQIRSACLSRDGRTVVYSAAWEGRPLQLFLLRLDSTDARPVALEPHHARVVSLSSRGEVAILLPPDPDTVLLPSFKSGTLARIPLTGGTPRAVAEGVRDADWDPSGDQFAVARGVEAGVQLEYPIGEVLHHVAGDITGVRVSPSGDLVAFFDHPFENNNRGAVAVVDRDGEARTLCAELENLTGLAWSPDGREIWFSGADAAGDALFAIDLSGQLRVVRRSPGSLALHGTTPDGAVLVSHYLFHAGIAALAPGETSERDLSWRRTSLVTDISSDGSEILFMRQDAMEYDVWLRRTDGSPPARLGSGVSLSLSPDGRWALAGALSPTSPLTLLPTGAGTPRVLEGKSGALFADWTPDGERIVWAAAGPTGAARLYVQAIAGGEITTISEEGIQTGVDRPFHVSPDGRWVAVLGPHSTVKLYPVEGGPPRDVSGALPGDEPSGWTEDGSALFVSQFERLPAQIFRLDLQGGSRSLWRELMPGDPAGIAGVYSLALTPDGQSYAYTYVRYLSSLYLVTGME
jgi:Tol biopolymer transport system component